MLTVSSLESATVCGAGSIFYDEPQCEIVFHPVTFPDPAAYTWHVWTRLEDLVCVFFCAIL